MADVFAACLKHLLPIRLFYIASKDFGFYTKAACLGGTGSKSSHRQSAQHNAFLSDTSVQSTGPKQTAPWLQAFFVKGFEAEAEDRPGEEV